ncbi:hypothetical protein GEMRC1_009327 [Eukaryota sp. GEM-RC1]
MGNFDVLNVLPLFDILPKINQHNAILNLVLYLQSQHTAFSFDFLLEKAPHVRSTVSYSETLFFANSTEIYRIPLEHFDRVINSPQFKVQHIPFLALCVAKSLINYTDDTLINEVFQKLSQKKFNPFSPFQSHFTFVDLNPLIGVH